MVKTSILSACALLLSACASQEPTIIHTESQEIIAVPESTVIDEDDYLEDHVAY